jgi:hypothetical protein
MNNMMNWNNQSGSLPFDVNQPSNPFIQPEAAPYPMLQVSGSMQQLVPYIAQLLVNNIQASYNQNKLRMFFYNQMSVNGYRNQDFQMLVQKTCELIEMAIIASPQNDPAQVAGQWVEIYVQYKVVDNLNVFQALLQQVDPGTINVAQQVINQFQVNAQALEQAANMAYRQQAQPQYQQQMGYQAPTGVPAWAVNRQPQQAPPPPAWANTQPAGAQVRAAWQNPKPAIAQQVQATQAPPAARKVIPAMIEQIVFERSDKYPYDTVFDPSMFEKTYEKEDEVIKPFVITKRVTQMDREKHLEKASFTPEWVKQPTADEVLVRVQKAKPTPFESPFTYVFNDPLADAFPSTTLIEQWSKVNALLLARKSETTKIVCATHTGALIETVVSPKDLMPVIMALIKSTTPYQAKEILDQAVEDCGESMDALIAIRAIDARITKRVNRFIKNEASLEYGDIGNYRGDVIEQVNFLGEYYGAAVKNAYLKHHASIMSEALCYIAPDNEYFAQHSSEYISKLTPEQVENVHLTHFMELTGINQVDMSSAELSFEFPKKGVSAGIVESSAAVLHALVVGIFHKHTTSATDCAVQYLRTSDGVVFELDRGVFNSSFYLISLVN